MSTLSTEMCLEHKLNLINANTELMEHVQDNENISQGHLMPKGVNKAVNEHMHSLLTQTSNVKKIIYNE